MSAIGPGDYVECINADPMTMVGGCERLTIGNIYRVLTVFDWWGDSSVELESPKSDHVTGGFRLTHFRPIYRPKQSIIKQLKRPAPKAPVKA